MAEHFGFHYLDDGQVQPADQKDSWADLSAFFQEGFLQTQKEALMSLSGMRQLLEGFLTQLSEEKSIVFFSMAQKARVYEALCNLFLHLETEKNELAWYAVSFNEIGERISEIVRQTESPDAAQLVGKCSMLGNAVMHFCGQQLGCAIEAIARAADFEHACGALHLGDALRLFGELLNCVGDLQKEIAGGI